MRAISSGLLKSIDPDTNTQLAAAKFNIPLGEDPTEEQVAQVEREQIGAELKAFHNPNLREAILAAKRSA